MATARRLTLVWAALVALTCGSFVVGIEQQGDIATAATLLVIGLAMFKVSLVGRQFMDVRAAPRVLRVVFDAYVVVVFAVLAVLVLPWRL